jgi:alkylated DNA repair dioxygenase AlkB
MLQGSLLTIGDPGVDLCATSERLDLGGDSWVELTRGWLRGADELFELLATTLAWHHGRRRMYDRMVDEPRLTHWLHPDRPTPHPVLGEARRALESHYGVELRGPGCNYYRHGLDSVAWHGDRELRHLDDTLVAVLTLGSRRPWLLRPAGGGRSRDLAPASGDLLVMGGACQRDWEHAVPKASGGGPRISVTWRWTRGR